MKPDLSIIIPSYKDPLLHKTIESIRENFATNYEIIPVLDGYEPDEPIVKDDRIQPICLEKNVGMRGAINAGARAARGRYIMRSDEHCIFCNEFDRIILAYIKDNQIVTARRFFLDPIKWAIMQERACIIYEQLIVKDEPKKFSAVPWRARDKERADIMVDENMAMQGSVWIMSKSWWDSVIKELQTEGYGPHYQDTVEMLFKTWAAGGKLMINKYAWYAHKHRKFNRTHHYATERAIPEWLYSYNKWYPAYVEMKARWAHEH